MSKKVCDFRVEKVTKTLIFYTHTHTHTHTHVSIGEQSPVAILTESTHRAIRQIMSSSGLTRRSRNNAFIFTGSPVKRGMTGGVRHGHDISYNRHCEGVNPWQSIRDCFVALLLAMTSHPVVIPDLIGYPENKKSSCADVVRWILGSSPRMTGKSGVIANAVWQSLNRLLRHFIPRNDGVFKNVLAMTGKFQFNFNHII